MTTARKDKQGLEQRSVQTLWENMKRMRTEDNVAGAKDKDRGAPDMDRKDCRDAAVQDEIRTEEEPVEEKGIQKIIGEGETTNKARMDMDLKQGGGMNKNQMNQTQGEGQENGRGQQSEDGIESKISTTNTTNRERNYDPKDRGGGGVNEHNKMSQNYHKRDAMGQEQDPGAGNDGDPDHTGQAGPSGPTTSGSKDTGTKKHEMEPGEGEPDPRMRFAATDIRLRQGIQGKALDRNGKKMKGHRDKDIRSHRGDNNPPRPRGQQTRLETRTDSTVGSPGQTQGQTAAHMPGQGQGQRTVGRGGRGQPRITHFMQKGAGNKGHWGAPNP